MGNHSKPTSPFCIVWMQDKLGQASNFEWALPTFLLHGKLLPIDLAVLHHSDVNKIRIGEQLPARAPRFLKIMRFILYLFHEKVNKKLFFLCIFIIQKWGRILVEMTELNKS